MAFDADLANRVRELLANEPTDEMQMFGGLAFLIGGNMAVAVSSQGGLLVRVPREDTDKLVGQAHVSPMVMAGRETRGWIRVAAEGVKTKRQLDRWVTRGADHARSLPPK
ncbi:TfoX/Sxy family protein [Mycobacterium camsae]|uniref:TfoX/Sxy family protein n=1 Tax=Mycobacterium gordonae TaxID=1778 RepID=UPI00197D165C|nr:TfoX/Sxy family protein [Mycobacterium gordonae]